jgi:hypothetical protein
MIFARTLPPLTKWFQGMFLLTQSKNSISTLELARQLGVRPDTASLMRHKLMTVMFEREATRNLDGRIEMYDAVLSGEKSELDVVKRGRGGPNKTPFVVAVATNDEGRPQLLLWHVVKTHNGEDIEAMARAYLAPTAHVISDGLSCFLAATKASRAHEPVNTVLGNLKTATAGTLKSVRPRYAFYCLAEFQYRFNRRFNLAAMLDRLACIAFRAAPQPIRSSKLPCSWVTRHTFSFGAVRD